MLWLSFRLWRIFYTIEVNPIEKLLPGRAIEVEVQLEECLKLRDIM